MSKFEILKSQKGSDKYKFDSKVQEYFQNKLNVEKNYFAVSFLI